MTCYELDNSRPNTCNSRPNTCNSLRPHIKHKARPSTVAACYYKHPQHNTQPYSTKSSFSTEPGTTRSHTSTTRPHTGTTRPCIGTTRPHTTHNCRPSSIYYYRKGRPGSCIERPPPNNKSNPYSTTTRKIKSAVSRFTVEDKTIPEPPKPPSPTFELKRTPSHVEMHILSEQEFEKKLKTVELENSSPPDNSALEDEILKLRKKVEELEQKLDLEKNMSKEREKQLQRDFNKNLSATLEEKKAELRKVKEQHYAEINSLKQKMNDCLKFQRTESSTIIAKLKGEIDMGRDNIRHFKEKVKQEHAEELQDLQSELTIKHHRDKNKSLFELEEKLSKEKDKALNDLKNKLEGDINLLKMQHSQEVEEILETFDGVDLDEIDQSKNTIRDQEMQLMTYKMTQRKLEDEISLMRTDLNSQKSALKELQDSFFDKVHEVDKKYNHQLSSLLMDNKDLRRRYLRKCDELFTLKAAFNRLQEAKGYIAKEMLSALMQGKQPHVITSSAVKASWSSDGLDTQPVRNELQRSMSDRASSANSGVVEDPACLMLSTCSYIMDNSGSKCPRPISDQMFARDDLLSQSQSRREEMVQAFCSSSSEENLLTLIERQSISDQTEFVKSRPKSGNPIPTPSNGVPDSRRVGRPVSSVCVVRPHSRQSFSEDKPRAVSADTRLRSAGAPKPKNSNVLDVPEFNLPALPASPELSRRQLGDSEVFEEDLT